MIRESYLNFMSRIFITLILFVGASLLVIFYLQPKWNEFNLLRQEVGKLNEIGGELDEISAKRDALLESINGISKDNLSRLDSALPQGPHASELLVLLEQIAIRNNLLLKQIDISSPTENKQTSKNATRLAAGQPITGTAALQPKPQIVIASLPMTFTVIGNYSSLKSFLREIEQNLRVIDLTDISFTAPGTKETSMDFSMKVKTYYQ